MRQSARANERSVSRDLPFERYVELHRRGSRALLHGFAAEEAPLLLKALQGILAVAPFRNMVTPGGYRMSVAMTNCGRAGWITDRSGYRYDPIDPTTGRPWPPLSRIRLYVSPKRALYAGGYAGFAPDACLVNRYEPGGAPIAASRQKRARFQRAYRIRLSRVAGGVSVWRFAAGRSITTHSVGERRHRRLGRSQRDSPFRYTAARRWPSQAHRLLSHQLDVSQSALTNGSTHDAIARRRNDRNHSSRDGPSTASASQAKAVHERRERLRPARRKHSRRDHGYEHGPEESHRRLP